MKNKIKSRDIKNIMHLTNTLWISEKQINKLCFYELGIIKAS
jgi:hypothetical protein